MVRLATTKTGLAVLVCFLSLQFACYASLSTLRSRAAFDLKCDEELHMAAEFC
jgi:hypothetical protein